MQGIGNVKARELYEILAPSYYLRPKHYSEIPVIREHWIRGKYARNEFKKRDDEKDTSQHPCIFRMPERIKEGWLLKANQKNTWQKRWFVLHGFFLMYYKEADQSYPQGHINIIDMEIKFPDVDMQSTSKKFHFDLETPSRTYPVSTETMDVFFDWVHAIRRSQLYYKKVASSQHSVYVKKQIEEKMSFKDVKEVVKTGQLTKQGGAWKSWNKRCFVLSSNALYYFKSSGTPSPNDVPEGGLRLDSLCSIAPGEEVLKRKFCFRIMTVERSFFLCASNQEEMQQWITAIESVIDKHSPKCNVDFSKVSW